jgi:hypothetical protein
MSHTNIKRGTDKQMKRTSYYEPANIHTPVANLPNYRETELANLMQFEIPWHIAPPVCTHLQTKQTPAIYALFSQLISAMKTPVIETDVANIPCLIYIATVKVLNHRMLYGYFVNHHVLTFKIRLFFHVCMVFSTNNY